MSIPTPEDLKGKSSTQLMHMLAKVINKYRIQGKLVADTEVIKELVVIAFTAGSKMSQEEIMQIMDQVESEEG